MRIIRLSRTALYCYSVVMVGKGCIPIQVGEDDGRGRRTRKNGSAIKFLLHTMNHRGIIFVLFAPGRSIMRSVRGNEIIRKTLSDFIE